MMGKYCANAAFSILLLVLGIVLFAPLVSADKCPPGTELGPNNSTQCVPCLPNNINLERGGKCRPCPYGAVCPNAATLEVRGGFWAPDRDDPTFIDPYAIFLCVPGTCCVREEGEWAGSEINVSPEPCNASSPNRCRKGYSGLMCKSCAEGYTNFGIQCLECDPTKSFLARGSFWLYVASPFGVAGIFAGVSIYEAANPGTGLFFIAIDFVQLLTITILHQGILSKTSGTFLDVIITAGGGGSNLLNRIINCPSNWGEFIGAHGFSIFGISAFICTTALSLFVKTALSFEEN